MDRFFAVLGIVAFGPLTIMIFLLSFSEDKTGIPLIPVFGGLTYLCIRWYRSKAPADVLIRRKEIQNAKKNRKHQKNLNKTKQHGKTDKYSWNFIRSKIIIGLGIWIITSLIAYLIFDKTPDSSIQFGGTFSFISITINLIFKIGNN